MLLLIVHCVRPCLQRQVKGGSWGKESGKGEQGEHTVTSCSPVESQIRYISMTQAAHDLETGYTRLQLLVQGISVQAHTEPRGAFELGFILCIRLVSTWAGEMQKSLELGSPSTYSESLYPSLHCHWVGHSSPLLQVWSVLHWQSNSFWSGVDASWLHLKHLQVSRGCCTNRKDSCSNMLPVVGIYQPCQSAREAVNVLFLSLSCIKSFMLSTNLFGFVLFFSPWLESGEAPMNCSPRSPGSQCPCRGSKSKLRYICVSTVRAVWKKTRVHGLKPFSLTALPRISENRAISFHLEHCHSC